MNVASSGIHINNWSCFWAQGWQHSSYASRSWVHLWIQCRHIEVFCSLWFSKRFLLFSHEKPTFWCHLFCFVVVTPLAESLHWANIESDYYLLSLTSMTFCFLVLKFNVLPLWYNRRLLVFQWSLLQGGSKTSQNWDPLSLPLDGVQWITMCSIWQNGHTQYFGIIWTVQSPAWWKSCNIFADE